MLSAAQCCRKAVLFYLATTFVPIPPAATPVRASAEGRMPPPPTTTKASCCGMKGVSRTPIAHTTLGVIILCMPFIMFFVSLSVVRSSCDTLRSCCTCVAPLPTALRLHPTILYGCKWRWALRTPRKNCWIVLHKKKWSRGALLAGTRGDNTSLSNER